MWMDITNKHDLMMANWTFEPNWYLLCLIFATCLIAKLLKAVSATISSWVVRHLVREPQTLIQLREDVATMREELKTISITESFADHSRLKRKLIQKEDQMSKLDKEYRSSHLKTSAAAESVYRTLILIVRVGVVLVNRSTPVLLMSPESLWPLSTVLRFPTGIEGVLGGPCWAIMCTQTIDSIAYIMSKQRKEKDL